MGAPDTVVEWIRLANGILGVLAFGLLTWRGVGRLHLSDWLDRSVLILLSLSVLVLGLGAARAAQIGAPFNELALAALAVNAGSVIVGLAWHRLRRWPRRKTRRTADPRNQGRSRLA